MTIQPAEGVQAAGRRQLIGSGLVIAAVPYQEKALAEILKSGARFLGLAPKSLADIYADIAMISRAMDARDAGPRIIQSMIDEIEAVRMQTAPLPSPTRPDPLPALRRSTRRCMDFFQSFSSRPLVNCKRTIE